MQLKLIFSVIAIVVSVYAENYAPAVTEFELPAPTYGVPSRGPTKPFTSYQVPTIPAVEYEAPAPVIRYTAPRRVIEYEVPEITYEPVHITVRKPVIRYRVRSNPVTVIRAPSSSYGVPVAPSRTYGTPAF